MKFYEPCDTIDIDKASWWWENNNIRSKYLHSSHNQAAGEIIFVVTRRRCLFPSLSDDFEIDGMKTSNPIFWLNNYLMIFRLPIMDFYDFCFRLGFFFRFYADRR